MLKYLFLLSMIAVNVYGVPEEKNADSARQAWSYVKLYDFDKSMSMYRELKANNKPGSDSWIQATYLLAVSLQHLTPSKPENIDEAKILYTELAERYPNCLVAPRALLNLGRIEELRDYYNDKPNLEAARECYRNVIAKYPNNPIVSEAVLRLAQNHGLSFKTADVDRGTKILEDWLKQHPNDPLAGVMHLVLGNFYFYPLEKFDQAVRAYVRADELGGLDQSVTGAIYWRIATVAHRKINGKATAVKYYTKIINDLPVSAKGYQCQMELKALGAPVPLLLMQKAQPAASTQAAIISPRPNPAEKELTECKN